MGLVIKYWLNIGCRLSISIVFIESLSYVIAKLAAEQCIVYLSVSKQKMLLFNRPYSLFLYRLLTD